MPEAGRTPTAQFERGDSLAYGQAGAANALVGLAGPVREPEPYVPSGDEEEFLYSQTDRPAEPLTAGMPVGPGPDSTRHGFATDEDLTRRVAERIAADPDAPKSLKSFARRALEGQ